MPKYIDADKIERFIRRDEWQTPDERWRPESEFGTFIDALPAEDVAPVVHAKWIVGKYCSNCEYDNTKICCEETKYCPHCGAKMDSESEKND